MPLKSKLPDDVDDSMSSSKRRCLSKDSEEYRDRRDRNNVAVKKSRERTRQKAKETTDRVKKLKKENEDLELKVQVLSKELSLLKDLFLSHAGNVMEEIPPPKLFYKPVKTEDLNSNGESDDGSGSNDGLGAGSLANAEAIQKDHEYSATPIFMFKADQ